MNVGKLGGTPQGTAHRIDTSRISPHLIVFGEAHLRSVLKGYASYYNEVRTHLSLEKDAPDFR